MKGKLLAITFFLSVLLTACGGTPPSDDQVSELPNGQNIKELVHEYSVGDFSDDIQASITANQLIVRDGAGNEEVRELPEDEFFVSIAPYIHHTHD